jgi:hypothetical protein
MFLFWFDSPNETPLADIHRFNMLGQDIIVLNSDTFIRQSNSALRARPDDLIENAKAVGSGIFSLPAGPQHTALRKLWKPFMMSNKYQETISRVLGSHLEKFEKKLASGLYLFFVRLVC